MKLKRVGELNEENNELKESRLEKDGIEFAKEIIINHIKYDELEQEFSNLCIDRDIMGDKEIKEDIKKNIIEQLEDSLRQAKELETEAYYNADADAE